MTISMTEKEALEYLKHYFMMGLLLAGFLLVHNELMAIRVALEGNQSVREDKENEDKVC